MSKNNTPRALETLEALAEDVRQMADAAATGDKPDGIDWRVVAGVTAYADDETGDALLDVEYFRHADPNEKWKAKQEIERRAAAAGLNLERFGDGDGSDGPIVVYRHNEQPVRVLHGEGGELEVLWGDDTSRQTDDAEIVDRTRHLFAQHGVALSEDAIRHNLGAWRADFKSGYRDEKAGFHLFTPCGCNPLSFRASPLAPEHAAWQKTYVFTPEKKSTVRKYAITVTNGNRVVSESEFFVENDAKATEVFRDEAGKGGSVYLYCFDERGKPKLLKSSEEPDYD